MATKHRRIALTADPELEAAIAAGRAEIGEIAESKLVRELVLRGARDLAQDSTAQAIAELSRSGARWPSRTLAEGVADAPLPTEPDRAEPYRATRALEETRDDRV